jgi:hypothetical protein
MWVDVIVGIGTLLLAIFAFYTLIITQKQLKSFQKQTGISVSQNQPHLLMISHSFKTNKLTLTLSNIGKQPAFDIVCAVNFCEAKKIQDKKDVEWFFNFKWPGVSKDDIIDLFDLSKDRKLNYSDIEYLGGEKIAVQREESVTYLLRNVGDESYLNPDEQGIQFHCEPTFYISNISDDRKKLLLTGIVEDNKYFTKALNFSKFKSFLIENKIQYAHIQFSLFCKDPLEKTVFNRYISSCILDVEQDKSLEEAMSKPRSLKYKRMDHYDIVKMVGSTTKFFYENTKRLSYNFDEEEK